MISLLMKRFMMILSAALVAATSFTSLAFACTEGETKTLNGKTYTCTCNTLSNGQKVCAFGTN